MHRHLLHCGLQSPPSSWHCWKSYRYAVIALLFLWVLFIWKKDFWGWWRVATMVKMINCNLTRLNLNLNETCVAYSRTEDVNNLRRWSATLALCRPFTKTTVAKRAFRCTAPAIWNSLPKTVLDSDTATSFKSRLKTHLLSQAFSHTPTDH